MTPEVPKNPIGLYYGLPNEAYHAGPGLSCTGMKELLRSPKHYFGKYLDPTRPEPEEEPGQLLGSLFHTALFEPAEFHLRYAAAPVGVRRNSKKWDDFEASLRKGQRGVAAKEHTTALNMARSMRSVGDARELLSRGQPEVSAYAEYEVTDDDGEITKVLVRVRPDWVHDVDADSVILFDGKSCGDASIGEFSRQIAKKLYHMQAALYMDVYAKASGKVVREFVFGQCEAKWPHVANTCALYPDDIEKGRALYRQAIQTYARCIKSGNWPGYSETVQLAMLPAWTKGAAK